MTRSVPISPDLGDWIAEEARRRTIGRRVLVNAAVRLLREALEVAPDLVNVPGPIPSAVDRRAELRRRAGIDP